MLTRPTDSDLDIVLKLSKIAEKKGLSRLSEALEKVGIYATIKRDLSSYPDVPTSQRRYFAAVSRALSCRN
jgi:uncharacterized protein YihD (DUF1040 family)